MLTEQDTDGEPGGTAFSVALRNAISASGLSLDRIQARLQARGVSVSVTALSYWQSGKRQPERQSSISAVRALEEILDLVAGSLLGLLPPPRPRGSSSRRRRDAAEPGPLNERLTLVGLHDRCDVTADGRQRRVTARAVFQATADGQDRWLLAYPGLPALRALRNCTVGRVEPDSAHGVTVAELLFDRPIDRGETHLVEYSFTGSGPPCAANTHFREFGRPVREYLLEVRFEGGDVPFRCWQYAREEAGGTAASRELRLDNASGVHAVALDFGPGVFGIGWS
ncbi:hypothetical protein [Qaidamihabitans albus]|uniref:hypothetical protein n=1 Tax=Qaidamihabitans albus TaxID=2795733 RepID=UPI0018F12258|nr:hypothetical protein [Qaidamihabitans albus]